jgi:hypothetical protein
VQASIGVAQGSTFLGLDSTAWTAITGIATAVTALTAIIVALVALTQFRSGVRTWREETRAYVIADFESSPAAVTLIDFVIRNIGRTPAFDMTVSWDPAPEEARPRAGEPFRDARLFREATPMLAPGREYRLFFENMPERVDRADLPSIYRVTVGYTDHRGVRHEELFVLDLNIRQGARFIGVQTMHDAAKSLQQIAKTIDKSSVMHGPVRVVTETRAESQHREVAQWREMTARQDGLQVPARRPPPKRR